jgi:hypothetical protein
VKCCRDSWGRRDRTRHICRKNQNLKPHSIGSVRAVGSHGMDLFLKFKTDPDKDAKLVHHSCRSTVLQNGVLETILQDQGVSRVDSFGGLFLWFAEK